MNAQTARFTTTELDAALPLSEALARVVLAGAPRDGSMLDLERTMVLVPAGRLARAVERRLLAAARAQGVPLIAPSLVTPALFVKRFVRPTRPVLGDLGARLSWREAVWAYASRGDAERAQLGQIFGPVQSRADIDAGRAVSEASLVTIARRLQALARDAAGAMRSFGEISQAVSQGSLGAASDDAQGRLRARWECLAAIEKIRGSLLEKAKVCDRGELQRDAVRAGGAAVVRGDLERLVVLFADPEPVQRELLRALAGQGVSVEVCVHARRDVDGEGFPIAEAWSARRFSEVEVPSASILVADGPDEVADAAVEVVAALPEPRTTEQVALVACDDEMRAALARTLAARGVAVAADGRRPMSTTRLGMLVERLSALFGRDGGAPKAEALAEFVRHPDAEARFAYTRKDGSRFAQECMVTGYRATTLAADWSDAAPEAVHEATAYDALRARVLRVVKPLEAPRAAHAWAEPLRTALAAIVRNDRSGPEGERVETVRLLDRVLGELSEVPAEFAHPLGPNEAMALVAGELAKLEVSGDRVHGVDPIGWLDAGVADEPNLVFCGFNDGLIPEGAVVDPLLPDAWRAELGMPSSRRRAARDAWILDSILSRRPKARGVRFIVSRRSAEGDPMKPSRFLLQATGDALAARVKLLFGELPPRAPEADAGDALGALGATPRGQAFIKTPPPAVELPPFAAISVTKFKDYLKCPYLFLLRHHPSLSLEVRDEEIAELDAAGFGSLLHTVLEDWGRREAERAEPTADEDVIRAELDAILSRVVEDNFPRSTRAAVRVQIELARQRLSRFATIQAKEAADGWHVRFVELQFDERSSGDAARADGVVRLGAVELAAEPLGTLPAGTSILLRGRIDRVDFNERLGRWRALDYKSSSKGASPASEHFSSRSKSWKDLQLPLYRHLLSQISAADRAALGIDSPILLDDTGIGYVVLGSSVSATRFSFLSETKQPLDLDDAVREAKRIVAAICERKFEPASRSAVKAGDPYAPIWGLGLRGIDDDESAGGEDGGEESGGGE